MVIDKVNLSEHATRATEAGTLVLPIHFFAELAEVDLSFLSAPWLWFDLDPKP